MTLKDLKKLQEISISTFIDSFGADNTPEDMEKYINESRSMESLKSQMQGDSQFYFLNDGKKSIGYLKVNYGMSQTEPNLTNSIEVQQIYITKEYQNQGLGKVLLKKAMDCGLDRSLDFIWLGVWEHNSAAIRFYERQGFAKFGKHSFVLGTDVQTDLLMKKSL